MRMRFWRRGGGAVPASPAEAGKPASPAAGTATGREGDSEPAPSPDLSQRIDGIRAWLAQVDRKLGVRTYALGAAVVLALAAGIVGVVLAVSAKEDSATKDEVDALRGQVESIGQEAEQAAQEEVDALTTRLESLEARVAELASSGRATDDQLTVVQDDIEDLRSQISGLEPGGAGQGGSPLDGGAAP